jgi:hypothetical protein
MEIISKRKGRTSLVFFWISISNSSEKFEVDKLVVLMTYVPSAKGS